MRNADSKTLLEFIFVSRKCAALILNVLALQGPTLWQQLGHRVLAVWQLETAPEVCCEPRCACLPLYRGACLKYEARLSDSTGKL